MGKANNMLSLTSLFIEKKGQTQFFFQEASAILIVWPGLNIPCLKILYKLDIQVYLTIIPQARMGSESNRPHGLLTQRPWGMIRGIIILVKSN